MPRRIWRGLWEGKKIVLPAALVLVLVIVGTGSYYAFFKKDKKKLPQVTITPVAQLEYKANNTDKTITDITSQAKVGKLNEAMAAADKFAATASADDKRTAYLTVANYCQFRQLYSCVDKYLSAIERSRLSLAQMIYLAEAQEKIGKKTDAKALWTYIRDNKATLYDKSEAKADVDKRVNDALQRLGQ